MDSALATIARSSLKTGLPTFKVGQTVRIHQRIKEGEKQRIQVFEGLIIQMNNGTGVNGTITVRRIVGGIGVERVYPIHSPNIAKIEITKESKVRRSKLYYMRERTGKAARLKSKILEGQVFEPKPFEEEVAEEEVAADAEAPAAEAAAPAPETADASVENAAAEAAAEEKTEAPAEAKAEEPAAEEKAEEAAPEAPAEEPAAEEKAAESAEEKAEEAAEEEKAE